MAFFGSFAVKLRFPGSPLFCYFCEASRQGLPLRSTVSLSEVGVFGSIESAAVWMAGRGIAEGKPVPVGVGMVPTIEPFDAATVDLVNLRGALFEIPKDPQGKPLPAPARKPAEPPKPVAPARAAQSFLF